MPVIPQIGANKDEIVALRRDFHENPELGMEERRTAGIVAEKLREWGIETHTNVGNTGVVVAILKGNQ